MDKRFHEEDERTTDMLEFERLLAQDDAGQSPDIKENEIARGRVIQIDGEVVLIDIGFKSEGRIAVAEFQDEGGRITVAVGDEVEVLVLKREDDHGGCSVSKLEADRRRRWEEIEKKKEAGELVRGRIIGRVKGGLQVDIGVPAFLPGSQVELRPTRNLDKFINQDFDFRIIKFNKNRKNIVLSRRVLLEEERETLKKDTLKRLVEGAILDGVVKNVTDYGAFVDLGGIDGLLHITDMSWGRVSRPEEVVNIGDKLRVKVLKFNADTERVSLGLKQLQPDPWVHAEDRYPVQCHVLGRVVSLVDYGAFVELEEGIEGLVHVSEMSWTQRVKHPNKVVNKGDIIHAIVLRLDGGEKKISLGMKQLETNPWTLLDEKYPVGTRIVGRIRNITDFGIFIGIEDGIDGLVHNNDIAWNPKFKHASELFEKGDEVEAVVLAIDVENERFSLGIKQLTPDPWETLIDRFPPGTITDAVIQKTTEYGAFAELEKDIEGLIHISELAVEHIDDPTQVVKPGDRVRVEVLSVDPKDRRISLSIRSYKQRAEMGTLREYRDEDARTGLGAILKEHLGSDGDE